MDLATTGNTIIPYDHSALRARCLPIGKRLQALAQQFGFAEAFEAIGAFVAEQGPEPLHVLEIEIVEMVARWLPPIRPRDLAVLRRHRVQYFAWEAR